MFLNWIHSFSFEEVMVARPKPAELVPPGPLKKPALAPVPEPPMVV
jgi:hypothetical protein